MVFVLHLVQLLGTLVLEVLHHHADHQLAVLLHSLRLFSLFALRNEVKHLLSRVLRVDRDFQASRHNHFQLSLEETAKDEEVSIR